MGKLIYSLTVSLDGYIADKNGDLDWGQPTEEVHLFIDDKLKNTGTFLFGRRMYDTMAVWDTIPADGPSDGMNRFADIWKASNKIVYSTTLDGVTTANTTLEHEFDAEKVRQLLAASDKDFGIGGPQLAAAAIRAGLVDKFHQYVVPKILGGGTRWLPEGVEADLELVETQQFENGVVHLEYRRG